MMDGGYRIGSSTDTPPSDILPVSSAKGVRSPHTPLIATPVRVDREGGLHARVSEEQRLLIGSMKLFVRSGHQVGNGVAVLLI